MPRKRIVKPTISTPEVLPIQTIESVSKRHWSKRVFFVQGLLLLTMAGVAIYFYFQYRQTPEVAQKREIQLLVKAVADLTDLPKDEVPTLATITNKNKLDNQPFFQRAENGDKILIYRSVSRAFLYRPSTRKLVDITTINIETEKPTSIPQESASLIPPTTPSSQPAETESPVGTSSDDTTMPPKSSSETISENPASEEPPTKGGVPSQPMQVVLYNGSTTMGITNTVETQLKEKFPSVNIVKKAKASKSTYQGYTVIDLAGNNADAVKSIADFLGGTVTTLPAEENVGPEEADILIIIGNGRS